MKIYTLITDNDSGLQAQLFTSEIARDEAAWSLLAEYYEGLDESPRTIDQLKSDYGNDYFLAWEGVDHIADGFNCTEQEIEIENILNHNVEKQEQNYCSNCGRDYRDLPLGPNETCLCVEEAEAEMPAASTPQKPFVLVTVSGGVAEAIVDGDTSSVAHDIYDMDNGDKVPETPSGEIDWQAVRNGEGHFIEKMEG